MSTGTRAGYAKSAAMKLDSGSSMLLISAWSCHRECLPQSFDGSRGVKVRQGRLVVVRLRDDGTGDGERSLVLAESGIESALATDAPLTTDNLSLYGPGDHSIIEESRGRYRGRVGYRRRRAA